MNILYISNLSNNVDAGLNWSVPASVNAQQKFDNVLWVDLSKGAFLKHWGKIDAYHNIKDFGEKLSLNILPAPFNKPDYVVFEGFYYLSHVKFAIELQKYKVPYIIIPRGSLTADAFHNGGWKKFIKKKIAHWLIFNNYIKNAASIQYLTKTEEYESKKNFSASSFILSNGFSTPQLYKTSFSKAIKAVFIGRQDIYQKGLDILFEAISDLKEELKNAGFFLDVYGPPRYDVKRVTEMISELQINELVKNHERGITGKEKEDILLSSDIFVLTSRFEGHPMSLIEALSYGLPSLITKGANMYDEILNHKAGWACETNKEAIKELLLQVIKTKQNYVEYSNNARDLALEYDWNVLAQRFHIILQTLIKK